MGGSNAIASIMRNCIHLRIQKADAHWRTKHSAIWPGCNVIKLQLPFLALASHATSLRIGYGPRLERVWSFKSIRLERYWPNPFRLSSQTCTLCLQQSRYNLQAERSFIGQL